MHAGSWRALIATALVLNGACYPPDSGEARSESPARLVLASSDTVVLNSVGPATLPIRVLDRAGRALSDSQVRYRRLGVDSRILVDSGAITCLGATDASVRVSLNRLAIDALVRCRPVQLLLFEGPVQLHVSDSARRLPVRAFDAAFRPVRVLRGSAVIANDGVASLDGLMLRPLAEGATVVTVRVGDRMTSTGVHVYASAESLDGLAVGHRLVAVPLSLEPGEMRRWPLPPGGWMLTMLPEDDSLGLRLRIEGASCTDGRAFSRRRLICNSGETSFVTVYHPGDGRPALTGELLVKAMSRP